MTHHSAELIPDEFSVRHHSREVEIDHQVEKLVSSQPMTADPVLHNFGSVDFLPELSRVFHREVSHL
jgi:hypothetical protein